MSFGILIKNTRGEDLITTDRPVLVDLAPTLYQSAVYYVGNPTWFNYGQYMTIWRENSFIPHPFVVAIRPDVSFSGLFELSYTTHQQRYVWKEEEVGFVMKASGSGSSSFSYKVLGVGDFLSSNFSFKSYTSEGTPTYMSSGTPANVVDILSVTLSLPSIPPTGSDSVVVSHPAVTTPYYILNQVGFYQPAGETRGAYTTLYGLRSSTSIRLAWLLVSGLPVAASDIIRNPTYKILLVE